MTVVNQMEVGHRYSFNTYSTGVLPHQITNVKLVSIMDGRSAERYGYNVSTIHAQVFPSLPKTIPVKKDFLQQKYYVFEHENGSSMCYGEYWIDHTTMRRITKTDVVVTLIDVEPNQLNAIAEVLNANGYKVKSVEKTDILLG